MQESGSVYSGVAASIFLAIASAAIGYTVSFVDEHRKTQIQNVNLQIEKLYGPLYAYSVASRQAWEDLHNTYRKGKVYYFNDNDMPNAELVEVWRRWMKSVFMPINVKMESSIVENSQLLDGNRIYPSFVELISHVESYKATVASWKDTDDLAQPQFRTAKANTAVIVYPLDIDRCIEMRLQATLRRRAQLQESWLGFLSTTEEHFPGYCS
ncbi:hypothetical protein WN73_10125 [Bradyrhizobium sp. CCBAU 45394]|nr:hypothetical protein [Bradyrhizobium sp. CCBAU 45394]MDA9541010.1 hypothetical protein [Bradyrhizobium sp. CCBAU 21362]